MDEFFRTGMGKEFFGGAIPRIVKALENIAEALQEKRWKEVVSEMLKTSKGREVLLSRLLLAFDEAGEIVEYKASPRCGTVWEIAEAERVLMDAQYAIRVVKSRDTRDGVIFVGGKKRGHCYAEEVK